VRFSPDIEDFFTHPDPSPAGRGLLPSDRHPRPASRGCERRAVRWVADDPLGPQDFPGDERAADNARFADVREPRRSLL